ncbi:uncharacterized protein LOC113289054 isoform X2 [Papaver somniferum]|uniref:uncharacterized protein LOC113289054 isoform X2 n=1 Tax=Papaver somniferum TaxID=3469 RepID=UPI000E6F8F84|nr:uncharacterized protein LOC113289054 isoform X2 [Papaver somniferum]
MLYLRRCVTNNNTKLKKINSEVTQETPFFYIPPGPETTFPGSSAVTQETSLIFIPPGPVVVTRLCGWLIFAETTFPGSSEVTQETSLIFIPLGLEKLPLEVVKRHKKYISSSCLLVLKQCGHCEKSMVITCLAVLKEIFLLPFHGIIRFAFGK